MNDNNFKNELTEYIKNQFKTIFDHKDYKNDSDLQNYEIEFIYKNHINLNNFKKIILLLKDDLKKQQISDQNETYELNVSTYSSYNQLKDIRLKIDNEQNIKSFCNNESLDEHKNIIFQQKNNIIPYNSSENFSKKYDINFNFNLKYEKDLNTLDSDTLDSEDEIIIDRFKKYYDNQENKTYRLKKRITFNYNYFKIDITIVKQFNAYTFKLAKNYKEHYEFEIELLIGNILNDFYEDKNYKTDNDPKYTEFISNLCKKLYLFNNLSTNTLYKIDDKNIRRDYEALLKEHNINITNNIIGPKPISLTFKDLKYIFQVKEEEAEAEELYEYQVTDKADGERYNLYINSTGNVYLINKNNIINVDRTVSDQQYHNTIIDGELITSLPEIRLDIFNVEFNLNNIRDNKVKNKIYSFNAFDIYISNILDENKLYNLPLEQRKEKLSIIMDDINNNNKEKYTPEDIAIDKIYFKIKKYVSLVNYEQISKNEEINYNLDGLILIPNIPIPENCISNIWYSNLKWKPALLNTIDFKIEISDNKKEVHLKTYIYDDYYNNCRTYNNKKRKLINFQSIQPFIDNIHIVKLTDESDKFKPETLKTIIGKETIKNDQIVECIYEREGEGEGEWKFLRIRDDKQYPNPFDVANKTFFNIFNTFKLENIPNIGNISKSYNTNSNYYEDDDIYNNNDFCKKNVGKNDYNEYYRKYNNLVKSKLINHITDLLYKIKKIENLNVFDIGCGRGGDILKFMNVFKKEEDFYLGIDIDNNNITGDCNARDRFINISSKNKEFENKKFYFITGDINKIADDGFDMNDLKKGLEYLIDNNNENQFTNDDQVANESLNNIYKIDKKYDKKIIENIINEDIKFDFINCQFMIHYIENLNKFFEFIDYILSPNGYFVATYLDSIVLDQIFNDENEKLTEKEYHDIGIEMEAIEGIEKIDLNEKNTYQDSFQTIINLNVDDYLVKLGTTGSFKKEKKINMDKIRPEIDSAGLDFYELEDFNIDLDFETFCPIEKTRLSNIDNQYKVQIEKFSKINKLVIIKKKGTIGGGKTELGFINYILGL